MELLYKLLRQNVSIMQTAVFFIANLLGGIIVLLGIEAYCDFRSMSGVDNNSLSSNTVVINKNLPSDATISSLLGMRPSFTDQEIEELESLPSVSAVGKFIAARFEVVAVLSISSSRVSSDIFLEAVPDEFVIDNYTPVEGVSSRWSAELGDTIPVIIPRNYLNLYNFGYAASNGMPQVSNDLVGYLPLKLVFRTVNGNIAYDAVICGLTDKFNTILVPWNFLNNANEEYMPDSDDAPSRLILSTEASDFDEVTFDFFAEKGYVVEGDAMSVKLQNFAYGLLYIIIGVGTVFSILAFVLLVVSILLLIEKNKDKISNLYSIGYSVGQISRVYCIWAFTLDIVVWSVSATIATLVYPHIIGIFQVMSPGFEPASALCVWGAALGFTLAFALIHGLIIYKNVRKHCK
ncbi:MAG: hypothetical protein IIW75_04365 [Bacteroidaceae bacterium]|nr:hypothetical protein [Bacteroidaceae bacterium]